MIVFFYFDPSSKCIHYLLWCGVKAVYMCLFSDVCIVGIGQICVCWEAMTSLMVQVPEMQKCQSIIFVGSQQGEEPSLHQTQVHVKIWTRQPHANSG